MDASALSFLFDDFLGQPVWMWTVFLSIVAAVLALDLGVLHKDQKEIGVGESVVLSAFYFALAVAFGGWVWWTMGPQAGLEYYTGFMVEWSLSLDNVFAISMIFGYFAVPRKYQHRVLFWGILGVIVMRGAMIAMGAALVSQFSWVLYLFGAFLLFTGLKMLWMADKEGGIADNPLLGMLRRRLRVTEGFHGERFWVRERDPATGKLAWAATPLFLCLVLVEAVDLVFAVDSVPAIFAITQEPFLVYTSNIFAILGLRALYFALAAMIHRFRYLKYALALVLVFIGCKIFAVNIFGKMPAWISLGTTFGLITGGVLYSLWRTRAEGRALPSP
jgi:tellurite resistance protein TerC